MDGAANQSKGIKVGPGLQKLLSVIESFFTGREDFQAVARAGFTAAIDKPEFGKARRAFMEKAHSAGESFGPAGTDFKALIKMNSHLYCLRI
jgi:hypothetical protein